MKEQKKPFSISGEPELSAEDLSRSDTLKALPWLIGGVIGGIYLIAKNAPAVIDGINRELKPDNSVDIVDDADKTQQGEPTQTGAPRDHAAANLAEMQHAEDAQQLAKEQASTPESEDQKFNGYNLWNTINLAATRYPVALIVVPKDDGRILASSTADPLPYSPKNQEIFQDQGSFTILSYVPWGNPQYARHPRTWPHNGINDKYKFFAGRLEQALRTAPTGVTLTTEEMLLSAPERFMGATAYLLQAQYDDAFRPLSDLTHKNIARVMESLSAVNTLTLEISSLLRTPNRLLSEALSEPVLEDPIAWQQMRSYELGGVGLENPFEGDKWWISLCSRSTADEIVANKGDSRIDEGLWDISFKPIAQRITFDPSAV